MKNPMNLLRKVVQYSLFPDIVPTKLVDIRKDLSEPASYSHLFDMARVFFTLTALFQYKTEAGGFKVTELRVSRIGRKYRVMLKASKRTTNVVAFTTGHSLEDSLTTVADAVRTGTIKWHPDRYVSRHTRPSD